VTYLTDHPTKAAQVTLAIALGGVEASTSRDTWRNPDPRRAAYLHALNAWGYPLTPVEKIAAMVTDEDLETGTTTEVTE
jgi:ParB family chromosome partitioning protein